MSTLPAYMTPPEVARMLRLDPAKVVAWIRAGEIVGVDVSTRQGGRPRYRIARAEVERFLRRRSAATSPRPSRRRKSVAAKKDYFA